MRLLVTGVSGLLGLNLAVQVAGRHTVTGVMRGGRAVPVASAHQAASIPFEILLSDLTHPGQVERVLDAACPDVIVHCAALTDVDYCERHPEEAECANALLPARLASAAVAAGIRLLHISTDAVFDGLDGGYTETDLPNPINVYAATKLAGERAVAETNSDALIARVNFYGWSWQGSRSLAEWFYYQLSAGKSLRGFTDLIFSPLLVNDLVEILLQMIERRLSGLYHVVSPESLSKYDFGRCIAREFGFDEELITPAVHDTAGLIARRSPRLDLCPEKLEHALGAALPTQNGAIRRFAALYSEGYPNRIRALLSPVSPAAPISPAPVVRSQSC